MTGSTIIYSIDLDLTTNELFSSYKVFPSEKFLIFTDLQQK